MTSVASHEMFVVKVPYEEGRGATHIVVRLRTDDGLTGVGYFSMLAPWVVKPFISAVEHFAGRVIGADPMQVESITNGFLASGGDFSAVVSRAVSAIDTALWDLKAKMVGLPLHRLLGSSKDRVPVYAGYRMWWNYDIATVARNAGEFAAEGHKALKYRMWGEGDVTACVERTRAIREAVGPDFELLLDANQNWAPDRALEIARALEPYRLHWFEDPVQHEDFHAMHTMSQELHTPIATGESLDRLWEFRHLLESRAADIVIVDPIVGGITPWLKIAALCESFGKPIASHLYPEVLAHCVAAVPNGHIVEYLPWTTAIWQDPPEVVNGELVFSETPGLGLELDEAAIKAHTVDI
jgi:L-alanine-DL-glutamate epimerase-like enolase superfamily enzyme